jgi:hypothetical protein
MFSGRQQAQNLHLISGDGRREIRGNGEDNFTFGSELEGVAEEIDQHLAEPGDITQEAARGTVSNTIGQVKLLFLEFEREKV